MRFRSTSLRPLMAACLAVPLLLLPLGAPAATVSVVGTVPSTDGGSGPEGGLTMLDGAYYGTTADIPGSVYRVDFKTGTVTTLHNFKNNGDSSSPVTGLTALNGLLYGVSGTYGSSTVFSIDPATGAETDIATMPFDQPFGQKLIVYGGLLYGTGIYCANNNDCIFSVDPASGTFSVAHVFEPKRSGSNPGTLMQHGTSLYGTNESGGEYNGGTLFRFEPATNRVQVEHAFGAAGDGIAPLGALAEQGGLLYGTTGSGGASGDGTIFSFEPSGRQETIVHNFTGPDGSAPDNGLLAYQGTLYGATASGGAAAYGVTFAFDPGSATPQLQVLHSNSAVEYSKASPFIAAAGKLIATSPVGGFSSRGIYGFIFSVDATTGDFTSIHSFGSDDAVQSATSGLVQAGQRLYGVSNATGANYLGSIFRVSLDSNTVETAYNFTGPDGAYPESSLVNAAGLLFGTTTTGGTNNLGTVFNFDSVKGKLIDLHDFTASEGGSPVNAMTLLNGKLYGTTFSVMFSVDTATLQEQVVATLGDTGRVSALTVFNGSLYGTSETGGAGYGAIVKFDPQSGALTTVYSFQGGPDDQNPVGPLCLANGVFYGSTNANQDAASTLFKFDPTTNTKTVLRVLKQDDQLVGGLVVKGSKLFGTFVYSQHADYGGVLEITAATGHTTSYPFAYGQIVYPETSLLPIDGALFGTTPGGYVTPPHQPKGDVGFKQIRIPPVVYKFVP